MTKKVPDKRERKHATCAACGKKFHYEILRKRGTRQVERKYCRDKSCKGKHINDARHMAEHKKAVRSRLAFGW